MEWNWSKVRSLIITVGGGATNKWYTEKIKVFKNRHKNASYVSILFWNL